MWDFSKIKFKPASPRFCDNMAYLEAPNWFKPENVRFAFALWWNDTEVTVYCPFCSKTHTHHMSFFALDKSTGGVNAKVTQDAQGAYTFNGLSPDFNCVRRPGCHEDFRFNLGLSYNILFPFSKNPRVQGLSFEIETIQMMEKSSIGSGGVVKVHHRFRTVGLDVSEPFATPKAEEYRNLDADLDLQRSMAGLSLSVESVDFVVQTQDTGVGERTEKKASTSLLELVGSEDFKSIDAILKASPVPAKLINVVQDKTGQSLLHRAAAKGNHQVLEVLLKHGIELNLVDKNYRTPLMEASLWGCVRAVDELIRAGADRSIKDGKGLQAIDLAEESERNDEERHNRYPLGYMEDPFVKKEHRKLIRALLRPQQPKRSEPQMDLDDLRHAHFIIKSAATYTMYLVVPARGIRLANQFKTVAFLHRGSPFPDLAAVSGWAKHIVKYDEPKASFVRLNAPQWVNEAFNVASELGYVFEPDSILDKGIPGRFNACHAEIQLMAYFVKRNYFFRDYKEGEVVEDDILQLFRVTPRPKRKPQIIVSQQPCVSCLGFSECIRIKLGISFEFAAPPKVEI